MTEEKKPTGKMSTKGLQTWIHRRIRAGHSPQRIAAAMMGSGAILLAKMGWSDVQILGFFGLALNNAKERLNSHLQKPAND